MVEYTKVPIVLLIQMIREGDAAAEKEFERRWDMPWSQLTSLLEAKK